MLAIYIENENIIYNTELIIVIINNIIFSENVTLYNFVIKILI